MKQIARYRFMTIPNKLYADVRITVDETTHAETKNQYDGGRSTNLVLLPMINLQILRPLESDGNGRKFRPSASMNDSIGLTKFNLPTFIMELKTIYNDMKTPDLYVYRGDRLDLNDTVAEKIRRAFIIGRTSIEFRAVVIEQLQETGSSDRIEGIKMKFNNEESTILLTLREVESMLWIFNHVDIDNIVLTMYMNLIERNSYERKKPVVDITPVSKPIYNQAQPVAYTSVVNSTSTEAPAKKEKNKPVKQETVIELPADKYRIDDTLNTEDDFSQYMNPPEPPVAE